jgi:hypothetical protein
LGASQIVHEELKLLFGFLSEPGKFLPPTRAVICQQCFFVYCTSYTTR